MKCDQCETLNSLVYSEKNLIRNILNPFVEFSEKTAEFFGPAIGVSCVVQT